MQDPSLAGNPGAAAMQPLLIAHIAEHVALLYRQRMQAAIGVPLPTIPDIRDPDFTFEDIDPGMDMIISQKAAQVVATSPQMEAIKPIAALAGQQKNPLEYAQQLAELEAQSLQARTQAQIAADQAKAQNAMDIKQAQARQDMEIEMAKAQADLQAKVAKLEADLQIEREKNAAKLQMEMIKNGNV
jgi:hypothetical protein